MKNHKRKITKAIIATAGNATRFLPETKNIPKQMLPIIDKPIIQYLVEEAVESGIKDIIIVTQAGQNAMEDYFDNNASLEFALESRGKLESLKVIKNITKLANFIYVRQKRHLPYGNGTPLLVVKHLVDDDEAFVYMFGDDLTITHNSKPVTKQLIDVFNKEQPKAIMGVQEVPTAETYKYGIVKYKENARYPYEIEYEVEKPPVEATPSNMAAFGRYVLSYDVINEAEKTDLGVGNELWLTDVLNNMAKSGKKVIAQPIHGEWMTTGDPLNYLKATVRYALRREDLAKDFLEYIKTIEK